MAKHRAEQAQPGNHPTRENNMYWKSDVKWIGLGVAAVALTIYHVPATETVVQGADYVAHSIEHQIFGGITGPDSSWVLDHGHTDSLPPAAPVITNPGHFDIHTLPVLG